MRHNDVFCSQYLEPVLPDEQGNCSLCGANIDPVSALSETVTVSKEDIRSWADRLESLRKCVLEPEKCTHDRNEQGEIQEFDDASIDMCLGQIVGEIEDHLT